MQPGPCNPAAVSGIQAVVMSPSPRACAQPRHINVDCSQARHFYPHRRLCSAFPSSESLAPFPPLEISREPVLLPRQPGIASHSQGMGGSWDPQHRKGTSPLCGCLAGGSTAGPAREGVQGSAGREGLGWPPASTTAVSGAVPGDMQSLEQDVAPGGLS